ncbi:hypothetical protein R0K30_17260 [Bacillus sp. SIMBA_154]|uniref:hypothetical protein n=1 Tax=Bacillus sp. SIMBA_154 TaxID=3080859 RepID=UPI00397BB813
MKLNDQGVQKIVNGLAKDIRDTSNSIRKKSKELKELLISFDEDAETLRSLDSQYDIKIPAAIWGCKGSLGEKKVEEFIAMKDDRTSQKYLQELDKSPL